jgi:hypothetical protein
VIDLEQRWVIEELKGVVLQNGGRETQQDVEELRIHGIQVAPGATADLRQHFCSEYVCTCIQLCPCVIHNPSDLIVEFYNYCIQ